MAEYGRGRGESGRVCEKSERMAECGRGRGKGWQSVDGEEGKDGKVWTGQRERMAKCGRGRGKKYQSEDVEEGSMAELAKRVKGWQSV